jgi:hypothetical protein
VQLLYIAVMMSYYCSWRCDMSYVKPEQVLSPRKRVGGIVEVIYDPGEDGMSVARIVWDNQVVVATRWNGTAQQPLGNPVSRRQPTWFVVGGYAAESVEEAARVAAEKSTTGIAAGYRAMARDEDREREALEWSEGMIGDATDQAG